MTDAEFLARLWVLRNMGLGSLDHAIAVMGEEAKWCRATTAEKWEQLHHHVDRLDALIHQRIIALAREVLPGGGADAALREVVEAGRLIAARKAEKR